MYNTSRAYEQQKSSLTKSGKNYVHSQLSKNWAKKEKVLISLKRN